MSKLSDNTVVKERLDESSTSSDGDVHIRCRRLEDGSFITFCGMKFPADWPVRQGQAGTGEYCFVCEDTYLNSSRAEQDHCWEILGQRNPNPL